MHMNMLSYISLCYKYKHTYVFISRLQWKNQILTYMAKILRKKNKSEAYQREQIQSEQNVYDIGMTLCDFRTR